MKNIESIVREKGFHDFAWINGNDIEVAQWVRVKCMFGCSAYGGASCPPNTPNVDECRQFVSEYSQVLIIKVGTMADKNKYPSEWSSSVTSSLLDLEKEIFKLNYPKTFLLNQSCCVKCDKCEYKREDCKDKSAARPSPEGFAIDVYGTMKKVGLELSVVPYSPHEMNRIAMLFIE